MKRIEALVKPELLVWARESAGLSVEIAAKKAQVKPEQLEAWEQGELRPSIPQLRKLGRAYKRPLAVFYLQRPPKTFQAMHDFRRRPGEVAGIESPELRLEIRKAHYRREIAIELFRMLREQPPAFDVAASIDEDPEIVAERARAALGITLEEQSRWREPYKALRNWRAALERLGILVFQASGIDHNEMRGFSISETPLPTLVVNVKDRPRGRIFTMAHELAHLMLRDAGLCDLTEEASRPPEELRIEIFCNHVAGAVLVPRELLLSEEIVQQKGRRAEWADQEIEWLVRRYQVSREAMLRRLLICGRTTEGFYKQKRKEFLAAYEEDAGKERGGFSLPDSKALSQTGHLFARLVLEGFHQEVITSSDVSDYLEVRLKWMPKIEQAVFSTAAAAP